MKFESKEQLRARIEVAMESAPPVTPARAIRTVSTEEYIQALRKLEAEITDKQRLMLIGHAQAPGHALTMSELATLVGFPSYSAANLQYGNLAGKLLNALGLPRPTFLVYAIASFDDDPDTKHSRAHMYPELVAALQELGWVAKAGASQCAAASVGIANNKLTTQQIITALELRGFSALQGLKVVRLEHPSLSSPLYVKKSSSIHATPQAPLVLHPDYETQLPKLLAISGVKRGTARYYHNSNLQGFPKRRNDGASDIAYGVDLGFEHLTALEQFLGHILEREQNTTQRSGDIDLLVPDEFESQFVAETDTEREALIKARIGQSDYRNNLLRYWEGCAVTNCSVPMLLRASHIKPWRFSSPTERIDPFNGLLLSPNLDLAFDQGLISFDDDGHILIVNNIDPDSLNALNITPNLRLRRIEPRHRDYLTWHREHLFRK